MTVLQYCLMRTQPRAFVLTEDGNTWEVIRAWMDSGGSTLLEISRRNIIIVNCQLRVEIS